MLIKKRHFLKVSQLLLSLIVVIDQNDILVSFDVTSLFTDVPLQETIETIAEKAFVDNWFNVTNNLNITKPDLDQLLEVATMNQLFQFDGKLYEQIDDVAMGSPLGSLMANALLCSIEEKLEQDNKLPEFYRRYVDDTFAMMKSVPAAEDFLSTLNNCHPSINFTMELASDNKLPFIGMEVLKKRDANWKLVFIGNQPTPAYFFTTKAMSNVKLQLFNISSRINRTRHLEVLE